MQALEEGARRRDRADAVVDHAHLDALAHLARQQRGELAVEVQFLEDEALDVDVRARRVDRVEDRAVRDRAVDEDARAVAHGQRRAGVRGRDRELAVEAAGAAFPVGREPLLDHRAALAHERAVGADDRDRLRLLLRRAFAVGERRQHRAAARGEQQERAGEGAEGRVWDGHPDGEGRRGGSGIVRDRVVRRRTDLTAGRRRTRVDASGARSPPGRPARARPRPRRGRAPRPRPRRSATSGSASRSHAGMPWRCMSEASGRGARPAANATRSPARRGRMHRPAATRSGSMPSPVASLEDERAVRERDRRLSAPRDRVVGRARGVDVHAPAMARDDRARVRDRDPRVDAGPRELAEHRRPAALRSATAGRARAAPSAAGCARVQAPASRAGSRRDCRRPDPSPRRARPARRAASSSSTASAQWRALRANVVAYAGTIARIAGITSWRMALRRWRRSALDGSSTQASDLDRAYASIASRSSASSGRHQRVPPASVRCAAIEARPARPAPRMSCSSRVSAWSSAWCASAMSRAPCSRASSRSAS